MLEIKNVTKVFNPGTVNEKVALNDFSLTLEDGDFVTVIGGNGAGVTKALQPTEGRDGTGSGGGGGSRYWPGQAGGSGIIIIRITWIKQEMQWITDPIRVSGPDGTTQGEIYVDVNAVTNWVGGDLVITYTNAVTGGGLRLQNQEKTTYKIWANAEILLVGGGGGGGFGNNRTIGGGAGGGAGGFIAVSNVLICSDTEYDIAIGVGGAAGTSEEGKEAGGNGGLSSLKGKEGPVDYQALGGVGGGVSNEVTAYKVIRKVNGEEVKPERFGDCFIALDLEAGEYDINLTFTPKGFKEGIVISAISIFVYAAIMIMKTRKRKKRRMY